jgi:ubiquinone/menaquinone biosynthesis C-methylase UbiE
MKTVEKWDYSQQAMYYEKRPNYSQRGIDYVLQKLKLDNKSFIADIGAGTANLTLLLLNRVQQIYAIEPTQIMMEIGINRINQVAQITDDDSINKKVLWIKSIGENTTLDNKSVDAVFFGSSFNTTDRLKALEEAHRILKPRGHIIIMYNNRDLCEPTQRKVEHIIKKYVPEYQHGNRRERQDQFVKDSGFFEVVEFISFEEIHNVSIDDYCDAWKSVKNTYWDMELLERILKDVKKELNTNKLRLPYYTNILIGRKINGKSA